MKKKVFIVDDTKVYNAFLKNHFTKSGLYIVETFEDGETALKQLTVQIPFVVILDHNLSSDADKNGIYYLKLIKALRPDLPVMYVTGDDSPAIQNEAIKEGALKVIVKSPTFLKELRTAIDELETGPRKKGLLPRLFGK